MLLSLKRFSITDVFAFMCVYIQSYRTDRQDIKNNKITMHHKKIITTIKEETCKCIKVLCGIQIKTFTAAGLNFYYEVSFWLQFPITFW